MRVGRVSTQGFRHEALLYAGDGEFLLGTIPFIRQGLERGEPVLVVERPEKVAMLRRELGEDANLVQFADMDEVGANPARIVPAWQQFVDEHRDATSLRGIGEPIWAARPPDELVECQRHESLLNTAFEGGRQWRLLCPYDTEALAPSVIDEARRSHAYVIERHVQVPSPHYRGLAKSAEVFGAQLSPAPDGALGMSFGANDLQRVRRTVSRFAASAGLDVRRASDLVCAANEVATNSIRHGGGSGNLLIWSDGGKVLCEVRDRGHYAKPLGDRERPSGTGSPSGLWLANQMCDLVQIRTYPTGTVVRLSVRGRQPNAQNGRSHSN